MAMLTLIKEFKMKNTVKILLCLWLVMFAFYGCSNSQDLVSTTEETTQVQETTAAQVVEKDIIIGYYSNETLNPYTTQSTANYNLMTLFYDSLMNIGSDYSASCALAASCSVSDGKIILTLKSDLFFSDGTVLTAADVVYSYELAKSSYFYSERLSNFKSVTSGTDEIIFTLYSEDAYATSCLDFPIVKSSTGEDDLPIGSGRYTIEKVDSTYVLSANELSTTEKEMSTQNIYLYDISKVDETILYLLQIGDITFYYDDLSSSVSQKISANTAEVSTNNLVYLGINSDNDIFDNTNIAKAFYWALDINEIASSCFDSYADAAVTIFNPNWYGVSEYSNISYTQDLTTANDLLSSSSYTYAYADSDYRNKSSVYLSFDLIVNSESEAKVETAEKIKDYLALIGVEVIINELSFDDYVTALENGDYDLYIGEVKLSANMDLSVFFDSDGAVNYGINASSSLTTAYSDFQSGNIDVVTFLEVFNEDIVLIPLCYKTRISYYLRELQYIYIGDSNDIFANVYSWSY